MIDIHTHVIPDIDDGPHSIEEAILMIEKSIRQGVKGMIATPHYNAPFYVTTILNSRINMSIL